MARKRPVFGVEIKYGAVAIYSFSYCLPRWVVCTETGVPLWFHRRAESCHAPVHNRHMDGRGTRTAV